jgi:hypothetical protein
MNEDVKKLTVSSDLERNLIFQSLLKMKEPIGLEVGRDQLRGRVVKYENNTVVLAMDSPMSGEISGKYRANFVFHNNYHYFNADVQQKDEKHLQLYVPEVIYKNMLRQHDRINVQDRVFMRFKIIIRSKKKEFENSSLLDERVIIQEVNKPRPAVDKILAGIKRLVADFAQNFQVKVFKQNEKLAFEENLVKSTKKIFLIYDSYEDSIEEKRFHEEQVLTVNGAYDYLVSHGESKQNAESKLLDLLQQRRNKGIFSDCMVPMMLEGETVGYIRLLNDTDYHRSIKPAFAIKSSKYAGILVEALVKYDYFTLESGSKFDVPIINISAGGLLFRLEKAALKHYLILRTTLQISIWFPTRQLETRGIIYRVDEEKSEYGVKFAQINEADMKFIEDIVGGEISL